MNSESLSTKINGIRNFSKNNKNMLVFFFSIASGIFSLATGFLMHLVSRKMGLHPIHIGKITLSAKYLTLAFLGALNLVQVFASPFFAALVLRNSLLKGKRLFNNESKWSLLKLLNPVSNSIELHNANVKFFLLRKGWMIALLSLAIRSIVAFFVIKPLVIHILSVLASMVYNFFWSRYFFGDYFNRKVDYLLEDYLYPISLKSSNEEVAKKIRAFFPNTAYKIVPFLMPLMTGGAVALFFFKPILSVVLLAVELFTTAYLLMSGYNAVVRSAQVVDNVQYICPFNFSLFNVVYFVAQSYIFTFSSSVIFSMLLGIPITLLSGLFFSNIKVGTIILLSIFLAGILIFQFSSWMNFYCGLIYSKQKRLLKHYYSKQKISSSQVM